MQGQRQHSYECMHAPPSYIPYQSPSAQDAMGARWEVMGSHVLLASHSIPLCTQQFPCLQVPRAVGGHGMAWSLHGRVWEPMGVSGSSWELSWEQCFLRVGGVLDISKEP